jgi:integrase
MVDGRQIRESARTRDRAEARRFLDRRLGERAEGALVLGSDRVSIAALLDDAIRDYKMHHRRTTSDAEQRAAHLRWLFKDKRAHTLTGADVVEYAVARQSGAGAPSPIGRPRAKAANATVNRELALLKKALRLGIENGRILRMPRIRMLREAPPRQDFFTRDELDQLVPHLPAELRPVVLFAFAVAWRKEEVLGLRWENVDLKDRMIRLPADSSKNEDAREIPIAGAVESLIRAQLKARLSSGCAWVFHRNGKRIRDFRGSWSAACEAAGLEGKLFHGLRRSGVRTMRRSGISEEIAMRISGHRTSSTFRRYNITSREDLAEAAEKIGRSIITDSITTSNKRARKAAVST